MNPTLVQSGSAGVFALAFVVVLNGALTHFGISMTPDVSNALVAMLTILIRDYAPKQRPDTATITAPGGTPDFLSKGPSK